MVISTLFVDRDGTINVEKGYVHSLATFEYIPGSLEALRLASQGGLALYIITNQAGIARGYYSEEQFVDFTRQMLGMLAREGVAVEGVLYCPHHPQGAVERYRVECDCRKPATGLLERTLTARNLDARHAAMIGDKNSDIEAGKRMGMRTYLVRTGYGEEESGSTPADYVVADLMAAVKHVLNESEQVGK